MGEFGCISFPRLTWSSRFNTTNIIFTVCQSFFWNIYVYTAILVLPLMVNERGKVCQQFCGWWWVFRGHCPISYRLISEISLSTVLNTSQINQKVRDTIESMKIMQEVLRWWKQALYETHSTDVIDSWLGFNLTSTIHAMSHICQRNRAALILLLSCYNISK